MNMKRIALLLAAVCLVQFSAAHADDPADTGAGTEYYGVDLDAQYKEKLTVKPMAGGWAYTDIKDESLTEITDLLTAAGIMTGFSDSAFRPDAAVTRGELAGLITNALHIDPRTYAGRLKGDFYDVGPGDDVYPAVMVAVSLGIANGFSDNTFGVAQPVAYQEAVSMLVRALGYGEYAEQSGGFPVGYLSVAASSGITSGVAPADQGRLTRGEIARLLYNTVNAPLYKAVSYAAEEVKYSKSKDVTMLTEYHSIYSGKGVVNANSVTALGAYGAREGELLIDSQLYGIGNEDFNAYLGYYVKFYYRYQESNDQSTIIVMSKYKTVREIQISPDDYIGLTNGSISFCGDNGRESKAQIAQFYHVVVNGKAASPKRLEDVLVIGEGMITLVSNDGGEVYDTIFVDQYENILLGSISYDSGSVLITPQYQLGTVEIKTNDGARLDIIDENGQRIKYKAEVVGSYDERGRPLISADFSAVPDDIVLSMFADSYTVQRGHRLPDGNATYVRAMISAQKVTGTVTEIDDTDRSVSIDGKSYKISKNNYFDETGGGFRLGSEGTFYLDVSGRLTAFKPDEDAKSNFEFGYLINAGRIGGQLSDNLQAKLMTYEGDVKIFPCDKSLKINGKKMGVAAALDALAASARLIRQGFTISQTVRYKINASGSVSELQTVLAAQGGAPGADEEHIRLDAPEASYVSGDGYSKYRVKKQGAALDARFYEYHRPAKYFSVPAAETFEDRDYYVDRDPLFASKAIRLEMYNVNIGLTPAVAVEYTEEGGAERRVITILSRAMPVMVKKVLRKLDDEGSPASAIIVQTGNAEKTYYGENENVFDGCLPGQVVYLNTKNAKTNVISKYENVMFNGKKIAPDSIADVNEWVVGSSVISGFGEVYYTSGYHFVMQAGPVLDPDTGKRSTQVTGEYNTTQAWQFGGVLLYDADAQSEDMKVRTGTVGDFRSVYKDGPSKASKVYWYADSGGARQYIIYNGVE